MVKLKSKKIPQIQGNLRKIYGSGNWTRTSDIRINSPLFYRLNYARITSPILYLKSAQVKDFLNDLYMIFICDFSVYQFCVCRMYNFFQNTILWRIYAGFCDFYSVLRFFAHQIHRHTFDIQNW